MLLNIGLCVKDLERSRLFYTEVFGFVPDGQPQTIGPQLGGLLEIENMNVTIQFLKKQGIRLELIDYASPETLGDGTRRPMNQLGLTHLAFKVTDIGAMTRAVEHMGGTVLENTRLGSGDKTAAIFVVDPDGARIELTTL
jgi:catechol 2,3-dioxygenase-like lactoylglutathione lyase family enzyme